MGEERKLVVEGFAFELTGFFSAEGVTTITLSVNGYGDSQSDLKGWAMEVCPSDPPFFNSEVNIISCEKRRRHGTWLPAIAQKTSYELTGDIGFAGVAVTDWVGRYAEDPDVEYRIVMDKELKFEPFAVAIMSGESVKRSDTRISIGMNPSPALNRIWTTPLEKDFCLFFVMPEGYQPEGPDHVAVSATKRAAHILHHKGEFVVDDALSPEGKAIRTMRAELLCSVRLLADVSLKCPTACGDNVQVSAVDCFEVCETIGFGDNDQTFELRDVIVYPKKKSYDLTLLNAHCGRCVYRLDGKYVIDCKRFGKAEI